MNLRELLGFRIKRLRKDRRLTQEQLGAVLSITNVMISSYEKASREPSLELVKNMAIFFDVSTDYLLGLDEKQRVSVDGLTDIEINLIKNAISELRHQNNLWRDSNGEK